MAVPVSRSICRNLRQGRRTFSTGSALAAGSPLFNLTGLATSRESQYFSKEHRLPRTEFSPSLQLIRSSEVDPFAPAPGASGASLAAAKAAEAAAAAAAESQSLRDRKAQVAYTVALKSLATELQEARRDIAAAKQTLNELQIKAKETETSTIVVPGLFVFASIMFMIWWGSDEKAWMQAPRWTWPVAATVDSAHTVAKGNVDTKPKLKVSTIPVLPISEPPSDGSTAAPSQIETLASPGPTRSFLSKLFWA